MAKQVKASHILVGKEAFANEIREKIVSGDMSFDEAATEYSLCPSSNRMGDLGYFTKGRMVKEFEDAAFALEIDEVSMPVKTEFGWHLILVTDIKE